MSLKVYENDVTEWVIAESPKDASSVLLAAGYVDTLPPEDEWQECDPNRTWELAGEFTADGQPETRTFAEWIARIGRGVLGTTEY